MTKKVACVSCGSEILPETAARNKGKCVPCKEGRTIGGSGKRSRIAEFFLGAKLTLAGGVLAVVFVANIFSGFISKLPFFRFVYSPLLALVFVLFFAAGLALLYAALKNEPS